MSASLTNGEMMWTKSKIFRATNSFNAMSKKIAQTRREILLNAIHDSFTPLEAMLIWKMTRAQVDIMTASMRKKGMIVAGGGTRSRIFLKVKEKCKSSFLMNV